MKAVKQTCGLRKDTPNCNPVEEQYYLTITPVRLQREIIMQISSLARFQILVEKRPPFSQVTPISEVTSHCH